MSNKEEIELLKEVIEFIRYPHYFTSEGKRIHKEDFDKEPKLGSTVEKQPKGKYKVLTNNTNSDCVNGVCPIK